MAAGQLVVTDTDDPEHRPLILDPVARTWRFGPVDPRPDAETGTAVAAGDQVLVWGGYRRGSPGVAAEGYAFSAVPAG